MPGGRPTKYTPETVKLICEALMLGFTQKHAAEYAGVDEDTVIEWKRKKPGFSDRLREAQAKRRRTWMGMMLKAGEKDWRAISDLMDRCEPDYRKKTGIEHSGDGGGPINIIVGTDTKGPD